MNKLYSNRELALEAFLLENGARVIELQGNHVILQSEGEEGPWCAEWAVDNRRGGYSWHWGGPFIS
jgi:hypothetical protein